MIVGCYSLHLYCDIPNDSHKHRLHGEFTGDTSSEARQKARNEGWKFNRDQKRVICPRCIAAGRRLSTIEKETA